MRSICKGRLPRVRGRGRALSLLLQRSTELLGGPETAKDGSWGFCVLLKHLSPEQLLSMDVPSAFSAAARSRNNDAISLILETISQKEMSSAVVVSYMDRLFVPLLSSRKQTLPPATVRRLMGIGCGYMAEFISQYTMSMYGSSEWLGAMGPPKALVFSYLLVGRWSMRIAQGINAARVCVSGDENIENVENQGGQSGGTRREGDVDWEMMIMFIAWRLVDLILHSGAPAARGSMSVAGSTVAEEEREELSLLCSIVRQHPDAAILRQIALREETFNRIYSCSPTRALGKVVHALAVGFAPGETDVCIQAIEAALTCLLAHQDAGAGQCALRLLNNVLQSQPVLSARIDDEGSLYGADGAARLLGIFGEQLEAQTHTLSREPEVLTQDTTHEKQPKSCAHCGAVGSAEHKLKRCSACVAVRYCGEACQSAHRRQHRRACRLAAAELAARKVA